MKYIKTLAIVIPCFNESETLLWTTEKIKETLFKLIEEGLISRHSFIVYVDDRSNDHTWEIITKLHEQDPLIEGIRLKENVGQDCAILAGLIESKRKADMLITMDADLQDDLSKIKEMIQIHLLNRYEIVLGIRSQRNQDSWFKRNSATCFYSFFSFIKIPIEPEHAQFRLITPKVVESLEEIIPQEVFLRTWILKLPFSYGKIYYERQVRLYGTTKYSYYKMFSLASKALYSHIAFQNKQKTNKQWYCIEEKRL